MNKFWKRNDIKFMKSPAELGSVYSLPALLLGTETGPGTSGALHVHPDDGRMGHPVNPTPSSSKHSCVCGVCSDVLLYF